VKEPATFPFAALGSAEPDAVDIDRLYRNERSSLIRFFARNRASAHEAEDFAQEAFLRFARADENAVSIARPASYLRQIGRNLLKDRVRSAEFRHIAPDADVEHAISDIDELGRLEARDSLRRLETAMIRLKPRSRDIFLAHRLDGMSYVEIAEQTGLSVKRVEKIMSKTIGQLTRFMEQDS
jgi:RNA polymerase sigma-70 factor (ECF subfamily)